MRLTSASKILSYEARNRKTMLVRTIRIDLSGIMPLRYPGRPERQNVAEVSRLTRTTFCRSGIRFNVSDILSLTYCFDVSGIMPLTLACHQ